MNSNQKEQFKIIDKTQNNSNMNQVKRRKIMQEITDVNKTSITQLLAKTIINNKDVSKDQETKHHQRIKKWFEDISKVKYCKELLDVVTQCENLKIIFDFESELIDNAAFYDYAASGLPFTGGSISIGAKLSDKSREQEIKGVLARELCRYAICLTYENKSHPYYKNDNTAAQELNKIIKTINKWTSKDTNMYSGLISSVIRTSTSDYIQMELIATAVQILVQFDDDKQEPARFEVKFKILFDYLENFVVPEMKKLNLKFRENVRKFNKMVDILPKILSLKLELSEMKDVKSLTGNNFSIIQTNFPKLLLFNIQKCLQIDHGNLFDSKNIFVSAENLKGQKFIEDYQALLSQDPNLNVFMIYSQKIDENLKNIFACKSSKFTVIVHDESQCEELAQELNVNPIRIEVSYSWNDLTVDSQKFLLQTKINFQNNSEFSFMDILKDEFNPEDEEVVRNFSEIIDDQLLGLMMDNSDILVNSELENQEFDEIIFQERKFTKREVMKDILIPPDWKPKVVYQSISQQELLKNIQKEKFVLISDKPGCGKSWAIKNFVKILRKEKSTKWVTFVDLTHFTEEFKDQMTKKSVPEFPVFMVENILKLKSKFEIKIFTKMYELGKVVILLDGFDELVVNCAEFVSKLIKSFEFNKGNQLWITTRDNIEVDLEKILELNVKYKLDEFTDENCVDFIASSWVLNDIKDDSEGFDIRCSENFSSYQKLAKDLLDINPISKFRTIGVPQCCKLIAEITKDVKTSTTELTELKIFRTLTQNLYRKWTSLKYSGTENQELNFWAIHELIAMKSLFPNNSDFCDLNIENLKALSDEDITAGGLVTKNDFLHETLRDFFVAEFILRILKKEQNYEKVFPFLMKILTVRRHEVTRMFLNQGFDDMKELKLSDKKVKVLAQNLDESTNISHVFGENLENLQNILIMSFKRKKYEIVKTILIKNFEEIFKRIKNSDFPVNPQIFLIFFVKFLNPKCLKDRFKKSEESLFFTIIESCEEIEHLELFLNNLKAKVGASVVKNSLQLSDHSHTQRNIIFYFCWSQKITALKIQNFLKILKKYFTVREIIELMGGYDQWTCKNILKFSVERGDAEVLRVLWTEIKNFYISNECLQVFKDQMMCGARFGEGVMRSAIYSYNPEFYETFWELLLKTLGQEELKAFVTLKTSEFAEHFIIFYAEYSKNPQIISHTFEIFEKIFTDEQIEEILIYKSRYDGNFIHRALECTKNVQVFEAFWTAFKKFHKSNAKFVKFLGELDDFGNSVINSRVSNSEIFQFIIQELKTIATHEEIKSLLSNLNYFDQIYIQSVSDPNKFEAMWSVIQEFFDSSEILEVLQNCDYNGKNFLLEDVGKYWDIHKFVDPKWNAVMSFIKDHEVMTDEVQQNIETCEKLIERYNSLRKGQDDEGREFLKLKWLKTKRLRLLDCPETLRLEITQSGLFSCAYDFYVLANYEHFEIHEISWEFILKKYENREDLVKLMTKRSVHGSIFIHSIMSNKNVEVINFILKIIQDNFNDAQIREILSAKCLKGTDLLSTAARDSKNLQIVQILWTKYENLFNPSEFFDIIAKHCSPKCLYFDGKSKSNIILHAAGSSATIFEFIWNEIKKLINFDEQQKFVDLVKQQDNYNQNILHLCIKQNDAELLKVVWNETKSLFSDSPEEFIKIVKQESENKSNIRETLNILQFAAENDSLEFHETLWQLLWDTFKDHQELRSLIVRGSEDRGENNDAEHVFTDLFVNRLLKSQNVDIIKFTLENIKKLFNPNIIKQILKPQKGRSFLENPINCIQTHQFLWEIYRGYCDFEQLDSNFISTIILNAVKCSEEIFKLTFNKIKIEAEDCPEKVIKALQTHDGSKVNIFHVCVKQNDKNLLITVWTEVEKIFKSQNLTENFKQLVMEAEGVYKDPNILVHASKINDVEFHKTLWELLLKTFGNPEKLKNALIKYIGYYGIFMYNYVKYSDINVTNFLHKFLKEKFTNIQIQDMFKAQSGLNVPNFLESCIQNLHNDFPKFVLWWKFFKKVFQTSKKFVKFFIQENGFSCAFTYSSDKILELIINDFKNVMTRKRIKKILRNSGKNGRNILYLSIREYHSSESYKSSETLKLYKATWKIVHEYFDQQEISDMVKKVDDKGQNLLYFALYRDSVELVEYLWSEIKKVLSFKDQIEYLSSEVPEKGNLYQRASKNSWHKEEVKLCVEKVFQEYNIKLNK